MTSRELKDKMHW